MAKPIGNKAGGTGIGAEVAKATVDARGRTVRWVLVGAFACVGACVLQTETVSGPKGQDGKQGVPDTAALTALQAKVDLLQKQVDGLEVCGWFEPAHAVECNADCQNFSLFSTTPTAGGATKERMRVAPNGKIGIGTPDPKGELDVRTPDVNSYAQFSLANADGSRFLSLHSGASTAPGDDIIFWNTGHDLRFGTADDINGTNYKQLVRIDKDGALHPHTR
jgi:hypothetical protein